MIFDLLSQSFPYHKLSPLIARGFQFLHENPSPEADVKIEGEQLYARVFSYFTVPAIEKKFESHRKYLDIQYLVEGEEIIQYCNIDQMKIKTPYVDKDDYLHYEDPVSCDSFVMKSGCFAIFYPNDGHKPGCSVSSPSKVKKVVLKVRL